MIAAAADALGSLERGLSRAKGRRRLVSSTWEADVADPSAAIFGSRLASDPWFAWEQPDRDGFALAGVGEAAALNDRGEGRFVRLEALRQVLIRNRIGEEPPGAPAGSGPVWVGGFSFAPDSCREPHWSSLEPGRLVCPELSIVRSWGRCFVTINAMGDGDVEGTLRRLSSRLGSLEAQGLPLLEPSLRSRATIRSALPPSHYEGAVAAALDRIAAGAFVKTVLAREVRVEADSAHDAAAVFGALREGFPSCFNFCVGTPQAAFVGASPELLVRRRGASVATVALAGSTRRSADPSVDDHLGEQLRVSAKNRSEHEFVVERIRRVLGRRAVWVEAGGDPVLVRVANIQHLATPIHAQLAEPLSTIELVRLLHPTPAVGGEPRGPALEAIRDLEDLDRGWYAGPIGWVDALDDGEFCVGLRSALLRDRTAHLYAGAGIVAGSDPQLELAETELKLEAMLPLVSG
ncbi:isochorismate synthase [Thermoleophilia bacterium SCSIO 60948]|nr:isochorismate synthase [Thermoleophilia bacterium SCSIO 60948]